MRHSLLAVLAAALAGAGVAVSSPTGAPTTEWAANITAIEACSCPMFCQCYFNREPAGHAGAAAEGHGAKGGHEGHGGGAKHFCRANLAYRINKGHHGATRLDGAKFWVATDLGDDFGDGELDWAVLYFDKALTPAQRDAIGVVAGRLFPVKWKSFKTAEATIDKWQFDKNGAHALLDGGKTAEVKLHRFQGMTDEPVVIRNLRYWGAPRNDGFIMMPNDVEAYRDRAERLRVQGHQRVHDHGGHELQGLQFLTIGGGLAADRQDSGEIPVTTLRGSDPAILPLRAPVAQLDRASASGAEGCRFEPCRAHQPIHNAAAVGDQGATLRRLHSGRAGLAVTGPIRHFWAHSNRVAESFSGRVRIPE